MPYQEASFVTPAFPDFPSGHSHFSRAFANVLCRWFPLVSPALLRRRLPLFDSHVVSPILTPPGILDATANRTACMVFVVAKGCSRIQPREVPGSEITKQWSSWADMAQDAGLSRLYGGIHAMSAHVGSVAVADALHGVLEDAWGIGIDVL